MKLAYIFEQHIAGGDGGSEEGLLQECHDRPEGFHSSPTIYFAVHQP